MFGPLPRLHRLAVVVLTLLSGVLSGAWLALFHSVPVAVGSGALLGALAGTLVSYALVHDFHHHTRPARAVRRR